MTVVVKMKKPSTRPRKKSDTEKKKDTDDLFDGMVHMEHTAKQFVDHVQMFEGDYLMSEWTKFQSASGKLSLAFKRFQQDKVGRSWAEDVTHIHFYEDTDD